MSKCGKKCAKGDAACKTKRKACVKAHLKCVKGCAEAGVDTFNGEGAEDADEAAEEAAEADAESFEDEDFGDDDEDWGEDE